MPRVKAVFAVRVAATHGVILRGEGNDTGHGLPTVKEGAMAHDINEQNRRRDRRVAGGDV